MADSITAARNTRRERHWPVHHRLGERADQNQRHEQCHRREEERDDEQRGDQQHRDAEPFVQPFAVEHEKERPQHDARPGVVLQDDDEERNADHHGDLHQVARAVDREGVFAHHAGQGQGRGDLGELHGCTRSDPNSNHAFAPLTSRPKSSAATSSAIPPR